MCSSGENKCDVCKMVAISGFILCNMCEKISHYNCSELPPYMILQIEKSSIDYYCLNCIEKKRGNKKQIQAIENEITNQQIKMDKENCESESEDSEEDTSESSDEQTKEISNKEISEASYLETGDKESNTITETDKQIKNVHQRDKLRQRKNTNKSELDNTKQRTNTLKDKENVKANRPICKFFLRNKCKHGEKGQECRYTHPKKCRSHNKPNGCKLGKTCKFWHPKNCKYGNDCRNRHCKWNHPQKSKANLRQSKNSHRKTSWPGNMPGSQNLYKAVEILQALLNLSNKNP